MLSSIFKASGLVVIAGFLLMTPAYAVEVTFTTTGDFTGCTAGYTCSGGTLTGPGGLSIAFTGDTNTYNGLPDGSSPSSTGAVHDAYGEFVVTGGPSGSSKDVITEDFTLNITQTLPTVDGTPSGSALGSLSGKISISSSSVILTFTGFTPNTDLAGLPGTSATCKTATPADEYDCDPLSTGKPALSFFLGHETYWVDTTAVLAHTNQGGMSYIEGALTSSLNPNTNTGTPEPALYGVSGLGIAGLLFFVSRRKKQVTEE